MIFGKFGTTEYSGNEIVDIFHNYGGYFETVASRYITRDFIIVGSPRPELLSYQLYGNSGYYWVLCMLNGIYDPYYDWVKSEEAVQQYAIQKYQNLPNKHHTVLYHKDVNGNIHHRMTEFPVDSKNWYDIGDINHQYPQYVGTLTPVTAVEHEIGINESRRVIKIFSKADINRVMDDLNRLMEKMRYGD